MKPPFCYGFSTVLSTLTGANDAPSDFALRARLAAAAPGAERIKVVEKKKNDGKKLGKKRGKSAKMLWML